MRKIILTIIAMMILTTVTVFAAENEKYTYVSREYNYSIVCPKRPNVVPAAIFLGDDKKKGEVLIFENEGYEVKCGWIIIFDAFNTEAVPDFNKAQKNLIDQYLTALKKNGYDELNLINISKDNKGILGITAKEIEVDEDEDGKPDGVLTTDRQEAVAFFRMTDNRCVSLQLMGTNGLTENAMNEFKAALSTMQPTDSAAPKSDPQKDKKDKKDKKNKKDKKK